MKMLFYMDLPLVRFGCLVKLFLLTSPVRVGWWVIVGENGAEVEMIFLENQVAEITATAESCWFSVLVAFLSLGIQALGVI